ncbi:tetratricopeptide repeat protein [Xanthobacter agilis]|uniref:Tetratricopeptide (TPR) repeat protein n=1 Tax=Xanthobacter agilis TaxID=47492 RepID=A0ABU0LEQ6_XANAG|nr:tetratricopeptide repeat protein [Xanthobacter agilis]MDQ0505573.1 tetratricopeptide (TPR) repeat protein [Xanthobacter agilis]
MERMVIDPPGALEAARRFLSAAQIDAADVLIDEVLAVVPGHVDALSLRGVSLLARGAGDAAFELLGALASHRPDRADIVANLGAAHRLAGRNEEARFCLERAVALEPDGAGHRQALAAVLLAAGDGAGVRAQAEALLDLGRRQGRAEVMAKGHALAGRLALLEGAPLAAARALRAALALRPGDGEDLTLLSDVLARLQNRDEALELARQLYLLGPTDPAAALLLARRLAEMNRWAEAERHLRRIVATAPHHVEANHLLATRLTLMGEGAQALALFGALLRRAPSDAELLVRMAMLVRLNGDLEKALSFVEIAARQVPGAVSAPALREELLLALGRMDEAWPPPAEALPTPAVTVPLGMAAAEALALARFAARLAPAGGRMACHAEPELLPLLAGVVGLAPTPAPAPREAVPLSDLPVRVPMPRGGDGDGRPTIPYLAVEVGRNAAWGHGLADFPRPLVGLVWDEAAPGLTLEALVAALGGRPAGGGTWVSLVFDGARRQLAAHPEIVDAGAHFADARDLVAAVAQLDLTVGVDSLALHVAGALGREGIVAVPPHLPWTWAHRGGTALWYPTLRVARQPVPGRWDEALAEVAAVVAARETPERQAPPPTATLEDLAQEDAG